ncbi:MAG: hypothetical protein NC911_04110 [Candidatus Omnitrophica bacterium]|nr:hypothetical protein [Candidatus Omnitrophota bacterium]
MKQSNFILVLGIFSALIIFGGCSKKEKKETDLSPPDALDQYTGVMIKAKKQAETMTELLPLKQLIDSFRAQEGRNPASLEELVEKGYIQQIPPPPQGKQYVYDPNTGSVSFQ